MYDDGVLHRQDHSDRLALGLSHDPCYSHDHDYERYCQVWVTADHVTMDVYEDQDLSRQNKQGRRDRVTLLSSPEAEAGGQEVAACAAVADTSSYYWVVVPSSVHRHQEAQTEAYHQHTDVRTQQQLDVVAVGVADVDVDVDVDASSGY
jgi:hypothetical protein